MLRWVYDPGVQKEAQDRRCKSGSHSIEMETEDTGVGL